MIGIVFVFPVVFGVWSFFVASVVVDLVCRCSWWRWWCCCGVGVVLVLVLFCLLSSFVAVAIDGVVGVIVC